MQAKQTGERHGFELRFMGRSGWSFSLLEHRETRDGRFVTASIIALPSSARSGFCIRASYSLRIRFLESHDDAGVNDRRSPSAFSRKFLNGSIPLFRHLNDLRPHAGNLRAKYCARFAVVQHLPDMFGEGLHPQTPTGRCAHVDPYFWIFKVMHCRDVEHEFRPASDALSGCPPSTGLMSGEPWLRRSKRKSRRTERMGQSSIERLRITPQIITTLCRPRRLARCASVREGRI